MQGIKFGKPKIVWPLPPPTTVPYDEIKAKQAQLMDQRNFLPELDVPPSSSARRRRDFDGLTGD